MCSTFKNAITLLCSAITLLLIYQLVITFVVEKPTTAAKLVKSLEKSDLPEVVVCMQPGLNSLALKNLGYHIYSYFRGALQPSTVTNSASPLIGWNGDAFENKSSHEILEEALLLPKNERLVLEASYTDDFKDYQKAVVTFRTLGNNNGRCMFINPPLKKTNPYSLWLEFNNSFIDQLNVSSNKLNIYLMDKANSPHIYPNIMEMVGQPIHVELKRADFEFHTRISKSEHVEGDPLYDCTVYTKSNSYDGCLRNELEGLFSKEFGCQPPYLSENLNVTCDQKFNVSENRSTEIEALFWNLWSKGTEFKCKAPCTKTKYRTRSEGRFPYPHTTLAITFDKTVDVSRSRFSIDGPTFLTKSGGFIGVGRTLLWILASLLGALQVIKLISLLDLGPIIALSSLVSDSVTVLSFSFLFH